ncbi:mitochondrial amidoxime reducing component 2-like [Lineus longissimus]|uniref:mitochondrial amidoxime reducing component 2-like n=1 Tax=Lineus longissimus TaxID=88925 RepID=UPI002B4D9543
MGLEAPIFTALPMILGSLGIFLTFYFLHKKRPRHLEYVGTVKELYLHPLKSCRGVTLQEAECTWLGLRADGVYDRHYLLCDPSNDNSFVGLCHKHQAANITSTINDSDEILVSAPNMEPLTLHKTCKIDPSKTIMCKLYGEISETMDCGDAAADWINQALGTSGLRLVYAAGGMRERVSTMFFSEDGGISTDHDQKYTNQFLLPEQSTYNLLSQASLNDLNNRLKQKVSVRNFRPNIVVDGCAPFAEDDWEEIFINESRFFQFALAERCTMTTVDPDCPESAHAAKDPLATLRRYRSKPEWPAGPVFGVRLGISHLGNIKVGDQVYVKRKS